MLSPPVLEQEPVASAPLFAVAGHAVDVLSALSQVGVHESLAAEQVWGVHHLFPKGSPSSYDPASGTDNKLVQLGSLWSCGLIAHMQDISLPGP